MPFQTPSNRPSSFPKTLKGLITAPPSNLITVVQAVVEASMAFSPLQPATGGLLKAIKMVEVCLFSPLSHAVTQRLLVLAGQKAGQNSAELAELSLSLSDLAAALHGPLQEYECSRPLQQRIENLSRLLSPFHSLLSFVPLTSNFHM